MWSEDMLKELRDLFLLNWHFFFRKSHHLVKCRGCNQQIKVTARPPRIDDFGPVGSTKCKCGLETVVSRRVSTSIGFSGPELARSNRGSFGIPKIQ
jgi:hypothetical protein